MLFQPTNVIPSSFAGVGGDLIDATDGMTISWQVNGTSPMTGYRIVIRLNNAASTVLYNTGQVNLSSPFYGVDGMGNIQRFSVTISAATLSSAGVTNGTETGYKFKITQYWSGGTVYQTAENYFIAQGKPTAAITTSEIAGPSATLTGTYSQAAGINLEWVRWIITTDGATVHDSGKIHTQELSYTYDGFLDDTEYTITLEYQTQSGYSGVASTTITSDWELIDMRGSNINVTSADNCLGLALLPPSLSVGTMTEATADYQFQQFSNYKILYIAPDGYIEWGGSSPNSGDTFVCSGGPYTSTYHAKIEAEVSTVTGGGHCKFGVQRVTPSQYAILWTDANGVVLDELFEINPQILDPSYFLTLIVNKNKIGVFINRSGTITKLFSWENSAYSFVSATDGLYVKLYGATLCSYFGIGTFGALTEGSPEIQELCTTYQPELDARWIYLSNWTNAGIDEVGNISSATEAQSAVIYRQDLSAGIMQKLCAINTGDQTIDFGVKSGGMYRYMEVISTATHEQAILTSGDVPASVCFWNWIVDTGVWDDERGAYEYTGSYIFGLNLETDAFDNGNNPNLLTNFTQYPTRQGTNQNYLSGQLTAYLGHVDKENNVYIDTAAEAEAIRALSTSTDTKFLRSRKGERWMIDTSGPIRLSLGDKYREQPYTVSLPWVEVGDASDAALISLPTDEAWEDPTTVPTQSPYITINGVKYIPVSGSMGINGNQYNF